MKRDKLARMAEVTQALYLNEFRKVQDILAEEARLRGDLARLRDRDQAGRRGMAEDLSMRRMGADLLWQAWLARSQRQLNIELSQVMAKKLAAMDGVRKAFGRQRAVQAMQDDVETEIRARARKRALEALLRGAAKP